MTTAPPPPPPPSSSPASWSLVSPPPAPPGAASTTSAGSRRRGLLVLGAVLVVGGLVLAGVLLAMASSTYARSVERLARAPIGCTTTLQFDRAGTFTTFVETEGSTADIDGDCPASGAAFRHEGDVPEVEVQLSSTDDDQSVAVADATGDDYDVDGHVGTSVGTVRVPEAGSYRLTASSDAKDVAIAVGKDPTTQPALLRAVGILGGLVLLVGGLILIALGLRRTGPPPAAAGMGGGGSGSTLDLGPFVPIASSPPQPPTPPPPGGGGWAPPSA